MQSIIKTSKILKLSRRALVPLLYPLIFISQTSYAADNVWFNRPNLTGTFPRIPIQITVNNPPYPISDTLIIGYQNLNCTSPILNTNVAGGGYSISNTGTYYLGLNTFTTSFYISSIRSIQARVNNQYTTSCIRISCSNTNTCQTSGGGPYTLTIAN